MAVNDTIKFTDYTSIRNAVELVLGSGAGNSGYGQQILSSAVVEGNKVTINEWSNLRFDILNTGLHQDGSYPTTFIKAAGDTIRYNATTEPVAYYSTLATNFTNNRFVVGSGQNAISSASSAVFNNSWTTSVGTTITVNWASANAARFFFNAGGQILVSASRSGGVGTAQNTSWTSLLNSAGTQGFGANNPGTGTTPVSGTNWYRTDTNFRTYYSTTASSPYGANTYSLSARNTTVANNSGGTASALQIRVNFSDGYTDPVPAAVPPDGFTPPASAFPPGDLVDGTLTVSVYYQYPTGVMLNTTSGAWIQYNPTSLSIDAIA